MNCIFFGIRKTGIRIVAILALFCSVISSLNAQPLSKERRVAFYNVENLFDTINDPGADDADYTPEGLYGWTEKRYREKIQRIARVLSEIGADLIGLAEVENHRVLDDLVASESLQQLGYDYIHFDSPDPRGIDVALLYRRNAFQPTGIESVPYSLIPDYPTRRILQVSGLWHGRPVDLLVCHLPSVLSSRHIRQQAAASLRLRIDSLVRRNPENLLLVLGDFNANPGNYVMREIIGTANQTRMNNPFEKLFRQGYGTYHYRGRWNMYDSILWSGAGDTQPEARIFVRDYLIQPDGPYRGYPYRSFSGTEYIGGTSDHLPVVLAF